MPTLNIKDPEVHRMASVLAKKWGTTRTGAVRRALSIAIRDNGCDSPAQDHIESLLDEISRYLIPGTTPESIDRDLYDENGLPR